MSRQARPIPKQNFTKAVEKSASTEAKLQDTIINIGIK